MSDRAGQSAHSRHSSASGDKGAENMQRQRETYERLQAEMSIPSTSGMASSSGASRKRPRKMKADEQIKYDFQIDKTEKAAGKVSAKLDETAVPKSPLKTAEHPKQTNLSSPLHFSLDTSSETDFEVPEKTSTPVHSPVGGVKRKRSHLLVGQPFDEHSLELNDDVRERRMSGFQNDKELRPSESTAFDDHENMLMRQIAQMSTEELADRVFSCMRLCAENKINVKNAFSLHLIDWLPQLLKQKSSLTENFSTLACTLDASAKIYSHRVDIVHREVLKLADMLAPNGRKKRGKEGDDPKSKDNQSSAKKKKATVVANPGVLLRKRCGKNPLRKYVKVGAHAGDLMNAMLETRKTFSTDTLYKPVCKKVAPSRGKKVTHKLKRHRRLSRLDRHSFKKLHGHFMRNKSRRGKKRGASCMVSDNNEYSDGEIECNFDDPSMAGLLAEFEENSPVPQRNILDKVCQKVEESNMLDKPEQFNQLSRVEKLGLVLNSEPDSFVNKDLEMLLYGPMHLKKLRRVWKKKPAARRGRKKLTIEFLDFNAAEPGKILEPPVKTQERKSDKQKPKPKRQRILRTQLTLRTINNWCENKSMLPEEIIVNRNYTKELVLRDDIDVNEKAIVEDGNVFSLDSDDDDNWEDMEVEITYGHGAEDNEERGIKEEEDSEVDEQGYEGSEVDNEENQDCKMDEDKENLGYEMGDSVSGSTHELSEDDSFDDESLEGLAASSSDVEQKNENNDSDSSMCSLVEAPVIVKVQELKYSTRSSRVNMTRLKGAIKSILDEGPLGNKENAGEGTSSQWPDESEGAVALPPSSEHRPVMFADVLSQLPARLDSNSAEDLTPQMAFLALLHVASENQLMLRNDETSDIVISKMKESDSQIPDQSDDEQ